MWLSYLNEVIKYELKIILLTVFAANKNLLKKNPYKTLKQILLKIRPEIQLKSVRLGAIN